VWGVVLWEKTLELLRPALVGCRIMLDERISRSRAVVPPRLFFVTSDVMLPGNVMG
jgi:hypothetical protein